LLDYWVLLLDFGKFLTEKAKRFVVLTDDAANLLGASVGMDDKGLVKVWIGKHCFLCHDFFHFFEMPPEVLVDIQTSCSFQKNSLRVQGFLLNARRHVPGKNIQGKHHDTTKETSAKRMKQEDSPIEDFYQVYVECADVKIDLPIEDFHGKQDSIKKTSAGLLDFMK
jgi:hypothetical protein